MAILYRAHFAMIKYPRLSSRGLNTSAIYGFTNSLLEVIANQVPTHIGVAFDLKGDTFRHEMYAPYKAQREAQPEDITQSLAWVERLLAAYHIPSLSYQGFEADDLIGTIALQAQAQEFDVYMMTPDKDFAQLVQKGIYLYRPAFMRREAETLGVKEVCARYGIQRPAQMVDLLALQGDSIDNIPGVPGVGPKRATQLLASYGDLEGVLAHTAELKGQLRSRLEEYADQSRLSYRLARIRIDAPVTFKAADYALGTPSKEALMALFSELEFRTIAKRLFGEALPMASNAPPKPVQLKKEANTFATTVSVPPPIAPEASGVVPMYAVMTTEADRAHCLERLKKVPKLALYLYTEPQTQRRAKPFGVALSAFEAESYYFPLPEDDKAIANALAPFQSLLADPKIVKIGEDIKRDVLVLASYECSLAPPYEDITLMHYLLDPEANHRLSALSSAYLTPISWMPTVDDPHVSQAACAQPALQLLHLQKVLMRELKQISALHQLYRTLELPLMQLLIEIEQKGVFVNPKVLERLTLEYEVKKQQLEKEIFTLSKESFNLASPKQIGEVLFEQLKLVDRPKKTKSGSYATHEDALVQLRDTHPIVNKILQHRQYQKFISTYLKALPRAIHVSDNRIHTEYQQAVAATGRLSANHPNLQNIPIRHPQGERIRQAFQAQHPDDRILSVDYSQIELRIMASFSADPGLQNAFQRGEDIHIATACKIFDVPASSVTDDQRRVAKGANFGIIYGISPYGLAQNLGIQLRKAKEIITTYFTQFPKVQVYMDSVIARARSQGYVETLRGRRRYLRDIQSRNATLRGLAERNAINAPIQGSAADLIKAAMLRIQPILRQTFKRSHIILQVHDELVFETHKDEAEALKQQVVACMEEATELNVPVKASAGIGMNWSAAH